ncbi:MAG: prolyl oligopeptidase family serine peptidase, partial [Saprospiraceae bacterium]|nr:prolyl oligopeptidase family serine peptidase [Saprospiraceae bacterium]
NKDQSRWSELWLFDIQAGKLLVDKVPSLTSAAVAWQAGDTGFYYIRYGSPEQLAKNELHTSIHYHQIGTAATEDQAIFTIPDAPTTLYGLSMNADRSQAVIQVYQGRSDRNTVYLQATKEEQNSKALVPTAKAAINYIGSEGPYYYFYSNENAANGKVIRIDSRDPKKVKTVIPEQDKVLAGGSTAGGNAMNFIDGKFVLLYREGTQQEVRIYEKSGKMRARIELETGWIGSGLQGSKEGKEAWFSLNTFLDPSTVYRIDLETGTSTDFFKRSLPIDKTEYVTRNTYYESFDGTQVPIYIVHKKDLPKGQGNPVYMYAYGFGGWVAVPWYQPHLLTWLDMGGIYVLPGVRGGGEFGDAWKEAGIRHNRPTAIKDYVAAAEFLVKEGYTKPGRIVANGWSASGSLATAAIQRRPALFGAGMIGIPSLDLLRYTEFTPFKGWTGGYGSPAVEEEFNTLYTWSPYHNIKSSTIYPPMMVTVGEKDRTTPPQHGYKFVAAMQAHQQLSSAPTLLKIVWGGGHGFGVTSEQRRETYSQELYFLVEVLGLELSPNWN